MAKILVVDDSRMMNSVIINFIKKAAPQHDVEAVTSGEEALAKYPQMKPDLVFLDIKMPGIDGLTVLERIMASNPRAKVVMCTSLKEPEQEARARKAGAKGYITKPFSAEDIANALKVL